MAACGEHGLTLIALRPDGFISKMSWSLITGDQPDVDERRSHSQRAPVSNITAVEYSYEGFACSKVGGVTCGVWWNDGWAIARRPVVLDNTDSDQWWIDFNVRYRSRRTNIRFTLCTSYTAQLSTNERFCDLTCYCYIKATGAARNTLLVVTNSSRGGPQKRNYWWCLWRRLFWETFHVIPWYFKSLADRGPEFGWLHGARTCNGGPGDRAPSEVQGPSPSSGDQGATLPWNWTPFP